MGEALRDAREAGLRGEVPIGAVLVTQPGAGHTAKDRHGGHQHQHQPCVAVNIEPDDDAAQSVYCRRRAMRRLNLARCALGRSFWREYLGWFLQPMMQKPALAGRFAMS